MKLPKSVELVGDLHDLRQLFNLDGVRMPLAERGHANNQRKKCLSPTFNK